MAGTCITHQEWQFRKKWEVVQHFSHSGFHRAAVAAVPLRDVQRRGFGFIEQSQWETTGLQVDRLLAVDLRVGQRQGPFSAQSMRPNRRLLCVESWIAKLEIGDGADWWFCLCRGGLPRVNVQATNFFL